MAYASDVKQSTDYKENAKMRIGIYGYGNLGKACEEAIALNPDMKLVAVFTRRDPESITLKTKDAKVVSSYDVMSYRSKIDVMINCGGSATDLPSTTAFLARHFNVIDSFDNHGRINNHFAKVDPVARENGNIALISVGWDPGFFSLMRLYFSSFLPSGAVNTFWGKGISQGHSEAIRHIHGVTDARQYTVPDEEAMKKARGREAENMSPQQMHKRVCYVSADEGAYKNEIEEHIKNLPGYFLGYDTQVNFITDEELSREHSKLPHGGHVISSGKTEESGENRAVMEMSLSLDSNPQFTAGILIAYARAVHKLAQRGERGCKTVFDIAPADLSPLTDYEIRSTLI